MSGSSLGAVCIGAVLLVLAALAWRGVWRGWSRTASPHMMIAAAPGLGAALLLGGLADLAPDGSALRGTLIGIGVALALVGFAIAFVGPRWYGPRWFQEAQARR